MVRFQSDLRRDLEALKRKAEQAFKRGAPRPPAVKRPRGPLTELVPGEDADFGGETFYRVTTGAERIWEDAPQFHDEYLETRRSPFFPETPGLEALRTFQETELERICYLDLETTGLSAVPLFLVGLMYTSGGTLYVDQLFARDYTEERAVLGFTADFLKRFDVLVTFNGLRFDIPFLAERMIYEKLEFEPPRGHVDLLPVARSVVSDRTPNHKLQTLERYLCNRKRIGDVPGSEIPGVYHDFVRTRDAGMMAGVFHHNRLDLLTMLQLVTVFLSRSE
ncbi:MAG: ribonuclease H-like domain-containing protein [Candidatus Krumholzibacteria bacterium]|nr:ribonuclease H-like domain-containing protein [Candidatus Krumholzibacteria bacterium]